jgi:HK97 family phage portal protein
VQIIATFCSQLPIEIYRNGDLIEPTPLVATKPDSDRSRAAFIKRTVTCLALSGNAYWYLTRDGKGQVVDLKCLNPASVTVRFNDSGAKFYDVTNNGKSTTYTDKEIQHLRLSEVYGHDYGLGPIQAGRAGLYGARDVRDYAGNWFANGGAVPRGVLKTDQKLTGAQYTQAVDGFEEALKYSNSIAVLEAGLDYKSIVLSPADALWLEAQKFSTTDIARLFGIPATYLLAEVDSSNFVYQNLTTVNTVFYQSTLMAYLGEIEEAFSQVLPNRQEARFQTDAILRTDDKTRADVEKVNADKWAVLLTAGVVSPEYVANELGLPSPPKPKPVEPPKPPQEDEDPDASGASVGPSPQPSQPPVGATV